MKRKLAIVILIFLALVGNFVSPWRVHRPAIRLAPEPIAHLGSFTITNTLLSGWLAVVVLVVFALYSSRRLVDIPTARSQQNIIETALEAFLNILQNIAGLRARAFFPVVATLFLYILVSNYFALLPGFGSIGFWYEEDGQRALIPLLRGATSDLNTTLALAICSVLSSQIYGIRYRGLVEYGSRFIGVRRFVQFFRVLFTQRKVNLRLFFGGILDLFVGLLEVFEELTKVLSFSFRLFGNVFGGEVLLLVIAFLVPYLASLPFLLLELITGFIQAFIFAVLSTAFFGRATSGESPESEAPEAGLSAVAQPTDAQ